MSMAHISGMEEVMMILNKYKTRLDKKMADELEEKGYTVFQKQISTEQLARLQKKFEKLMYQQGYHTGRNMDNDEGSIADIILMQFQTDHHHSSETINEVGNLVNEGELFDQLYTYPELLSGLTQIMGTDFKLSELT
ncbi:hypothetical protein HQN89_36905, partial [Paenibacillus frigoriresistens]|uniref:hypothetical protein n=1 Tax=Paenibacillus alginolyticus TaxID=59839 RepID=UPI001C26CD6C